MKKPNQVVNHSLRITGTGLAAMAFGFLSSNQDSVTYLASMGLGGYAATEVARLSAGLIPGYISKWLDKISSIKNHDKNHDLEVALKNAMAKTVEIIEDELFSRLEIDDFKWKSIISRITHSVSENQVNAEILHDYFFEKIFIFFSDENELKRFIDKNNQLALDEYIDYAFSSSELSFSFSHNISQIIKNEDLILFFKERFKRHFTQALVQELKNDEKAKTAYFKIMLELAVKQLGELTTDSKNLLNDTAVLKGHLETLYVISLRSGNNLECIIASMEAQERNISVLGALVPKTDEISRDIAAIKDKLDLLNSWIPNLVLNPISFPKTITNIFEYNSQYVPFVGRNLEKARLFDFLDSPDDFSWWMMGGPGGIGKSRLALEFCLIAKKEGYFSGFYKLENIHAFPDDNRNLDTKLPMLIVIDYALANTEKTIKFLNYIHDKVATAREYGKQVGKIRILLVDRSFDTNWVESLGNLQESLHLDYSDYYSLIIQEEPDDLRWDIIRMVAEKELTEDNSQKLAYIKENKLSILENLEKIDPEKKPLFALFAGHSLVYDEHNKIENWNINNLLHNYFSRLKRIWLKYSHFEDYEGYIYELLLVNTFTRFLSKKNLTDLLNTKTDLNQLDKNRIKKLYCSIADISILDNIEGYTALQPDLLGEFFIISNFRNYLKEDPDKIANLMEVSTSLNSFNTGRTLAFTFVDYFKIGELASSELEDKIYIECFAKIATRDNVREISIVYNFIIDSMRNELDNQKSMLKYLRVFKNLIEDFPDSLAAAIILCRTLFSITRYKLSPEVTFDQYDSISSLYNKFKNIDLAVYYVKYMFVEAEHRGDLPIMLKYISKMESIHKNFADNEGFVLPRVLAYDWVLTRLKNDLEIIKTFKMNIKELYMKFPIPSVIKIYEKYKVPEYNSTIGPTFDDLESPF